MRGPRPHGDELRILAVHGRRHIMREVSDALAKGEALVVRRPEILVAHREMQEDLGGVRLPEKRTERRPQGA